MIMQFRIVFGLKMGSSILTFRARQDANAPEASLEARWRDWQFEKMGRTSSLEIYSFDRTRPEMCWEVLENANVLVKMALRNIFPNDSI